METTFSETAIRQELNRVLQSPMFAQSERLSRFLRFTVEHVINGQEDSLKEYVIGTEVYDRRPPYHPSQDSIVRTEARRLRSKLKEYYELDGKDDPLFIFFRPGSYVPVFRMKDSGDSYQGVVEDTSNELFVDGAGVAVAVLPFLDISGQPLSNKYALGVTEELIHKLMQSEGCRVVAANSTVHLGAQVTDLPSLARKLGVQILFEGTVREEGNRIRVTGRIVNADGFQLWSQRLDAESDSSNAFDVQEQFASALVSRVRPQQSMVLSAKASAGPLLLSVYPTLLQAEALIEEGMVPDVQAALAKFEEVAQVAPAYARPLCGVVRCHVWMALHGAPRSHEYTARAKTAAERALKLDPKMADAITSVASVQGLEWKWEEAEASFRKAAEHRAHAPASREFAMLLTLLGRFDEACLYLDTAQRIDPFSHLQKATRARFFYFSRRYQEAVQDLVEPLRHGPIPLEAQMHLARIYTELGRANEARRLAEQAQRCSGAQAPLLAAIAEIHARCQDRVVAESMTEKFALLTPDVELSKYRQARLAISLGRQEIALSLLSASYREKDAELPYVAVEPGFDSLRQAPEFSALVGQIRAAGSA
jgi:TolB-like protein/Tfp pilus assembly protein PilF